jgi:chromosome segregation ATPase
MTDNNKNNISIGIEINASGQQQIAQYGKAFDSLRSSITNLSTPISKLDTDVSKLTSSISQLGSQNDSIRDSATRVVGTYKALEQIYKAVDFAITALRTGTLSLTAALTGGLTLVIAFLPEIIELTKSFFKGNESISTMAQNFKNLSGVMKAANTDAAEQTTKLNLLYRAATGVNTAGQERLKYAQQLKDTYPEQFKNFDREQIANGKAKTAYTDLAKSILASAKAKAALNKMSEETAKLLEADYQIESRKYNYELLAT